MMLVANLAPKSVFNIRLNSKVCAVLLIIPMFFEADIFSIFVFGIRVHAVMISEIILLGFITVLCVQRLSFKAKMPPLLNLLLIYLGANMISLVNSPSLSRGISILILLCSLVLLYGIVFRVLTTISIFNYAYKFMLVVGFAEICFGLYQVAAGMLQWFTGITLWVGHAGLAHAEYIQSPWGRPYGTFVEPDWYGAICMVYMILFCSLLVENKGRRQRWFGYMGLFASLAGLLFGFVRASWIGFLTGIAVYTFLCMKSHVRVPKKMLLYLGFFAGITVLCGAAFVTNGAMGKVIENRFSTINSDTRIITILYSISIFLKNPIIGNGPGCYKDLGIADVTELQKSLESNYIRDENTVHFDPSIVTTILTDTGAIGAISFLMLIIAWWRYSTRFLKNMEQHWRVRCIGLISALCGLFISYIISSGFWIPFTWIFLGFAMAAIALGRQAIEQAGSFAAMEAHGKSTKLA